ncbi:hypothetical protein LARI1_G008202 [Lachnellula arida]|uniref:BTB domain-containing protein n=1 Tax=Lachnellula arida TaxID=1316785 RepID=A0A8T9B5K4_9HELO|nr:hypothetical protein LARI1_G008202 [Lachnellula arida]
MRPAPLISCSLSYSLGMANHLASGGWGTTAGEFNLYAAAAGPLIIDGHDQADQENEFDNEDWDVSSESDASLSAFAMSNTERKSKIPSFSSPNDMVKFIIGTEPQQEFMVHREFACHYSPVLYTEFNKQCIDGQIQVFRMEEENPKAFHHFVSWIYTRKIGYLVTGSKVSSAPRSRVSQLVAQFSEQTTVLFHLWILAQELQIPRLQNVAMNCLVLTGPLNSKLVGSLSFVMYQRTDVESPLRHFMAQTCAWHMDPSDIDTFAENFDKNFVIDVWKAMRTSAPDRAVERNRQRIVSEDFHVKGPYGISLS